MASSAALMDESLRQLHPQWNKALIAASVAISFLGAFTSTQLMCHARMSLKLASVFVWSMLGSLIFGFCSIWCLHEVAMLAFEFDLPIGIDARLTVLSSLLAVSFTFLAIATDLLWDRWQGNRIQRRRKSASPKNGRKQEFRRKLTTPSATPLLEGNGADDDNYAESYREPFSDAALPRFPSTREMETHESDLAAFAHNGSERSSSLSSASVISAPSNATTMFERAANGAVFQTAGIADDQFRTSSGYSSSGSIGLIGSSAAAKALTSTSKRNPFVGTAKALYAGCTVANISKGFIWSLAITTMHYVGTIALQVPSGYCTFNFWFVVLSAVISWAVCTVGCILMSKMESHLPQQILFSIIAAAGVSFMHWTGIAATTFYSTEPPSEARGYPPSLANAVVGIAFITCITANVLLAHSATVARNKLAEIVWTRKELWRTIAQKENAEAAARARSEFIASASHEIRTPLHHLSGYSDLLAHTELTEEGRALLSAIQRATKTLSLITNNVLDWSKFERNTEGSYRPVAVDIRAVCESIIVLLPNADEEANVELYVVVAPDVPSTIFFDETWIHRILMNLLSNALKFTRTGYILLSIEIRNDELVATVRDTGCGLDPEFIPHMWTPFKQGDVRGSARGTGLGLSIIKQLLRRMNGSIKVQSRYEPLEGVGPQQSGTTFTVTLPLQSTVERPVTPRPNQKSHVAILPLSWTRALEGLTASWEAFGFELALCNSVAEVDREMESCKNASLWKYVWAEIDFLCSHPDQFELLLRRKDLLVLVPYNTKDSLDGLPGILSAPNFVMIPKPLVWHMFEKRIANARQRRLTAAPSQALRFATEVEVVNGDDIGKDRGFTQSEKKWMILLVEDNPVNQRLGKKMLVSLGYDVLVASDGVEALEVLRKPDARVDAVLMDQSMPRMDGVAATREIRRLEVKGELHGKVPVIALTAVVSSEARSAFQEAGADDFLAKPLSLVQLRDALEGYLGSSR